MQNGLYPLSVRSRRSSARLTLLAALLSGAALLPGCAPADVPDAKGVSIPSPQSAEERKQAVNERPDSVIYLPLGDDVLIPEAAASDPMPKEQVGPFELRGETLAGALQLILDGYDVPLAFETDEGMSRTITVANLSGGLGDVVHRVCGLADLYCSFEDGMLVVKETQTFTVTLPPVGTTDTMLSGVSGAISSITGNQPITDASTRTIVYQATQRTAELARRYFQRLRSNTAMVVFETYIWEVSLDSGNSTGINWQNISTFGKFNAGINLPGGTDTNLGTPVSIGLPTTGNGVNFTTGDVLQFISNFGAVKTISQPQITVLSGASARLRVADTQNYVASITRTTNDTGNDTVSTTTDSVDTGFTLNIASNWDNATVYGNINILLQEVKQIDTFDDNPDAIVQLPQTTEREVETQIRVRPGDSLLIAGLVRELNDYSTSGPGFDRPFLPTSRAATANNVELVFLLRPRVIVFTSDKAPKPEAMKKVAAEPVADPAPAEKVAPKDAAEQTKAPAEETVKAAEPVKVEEPPVDEAPPEKAAASEKDMAAPPVGEVTLEAVETPAPEAPGTSDVAPEAVEAEPVLAPPAVAEPAPAPAPAPVTAAPAVAPVTKAPAAAATSKTLPSAEDLLAPVGTQAEPLPPMPSAPQPSETVPAAAATTPAVPATEEKDSSGAAAGAGGVDGSTVPLDLLNPDGGSGE